VPKVHIVKEGRKLDGSRETKTFDIASTQANYFRNREHLFSDEPPTINSRVVTSDFAPYKFVVLEVGAGDGNAEFTKPGFYCCVGLAPEIVVAELGLAGN
jgi:hypothetical protein